MNLKLHTLHLFLLSEPTQHLKHYAFIYLLQHVSKFYVGHHQVESH
jgi:hypothetical protein